MTVASSKIPEDMEELRKFAAALHSQNVSLQEELKTRDAEIAVYKDEIYAKTLLIEKLKGQLAVLKRQRFGRSSEKLDHEIEQMELLLGDLEEGQAEAMARKALRSPVGHSFEGDAPKRASEEGRRSLPPHLPREKVTHTPECLCPECGSQRMRQIGSDEREVLEYVAAHFKVIVHERPKLICQDCEKITQAPMPSLPIPGGLPGPALLAHVMVAKYCDHLPLHRQSVIYARENVELDRSTLAAWVGQMAALLMPLYEAIVKHVRDCETLHCDDTPLPVLEPGKGRTKTARLWVVLRDEAPWGSDVPPAAYYRYSEDRTKEQVIPLLEGCKGYLHVDAYGGFEQLYEPHPITKISRFTEVACWAHARRKIYDEYVDKKWPAALELLNRIGLLFDIERDIRGQPPDDRRRVREERSVPLLEELKRSYEVALKTVSGKSEFAKALRYALKRWQSFTRYTTDGRLEISNNAAERAIRPLALGRKNWLFAGSDTGGERAAVMYTIIQTAKLNDLDPEAYLRDVIGRIQDHSQLRIHELLPWNVKKSTQGL
jgi:transposase